MPDYRLAQSAKEDLIAIAHYGDHRYGVEQSNRYRDQIKQPFSVLASQPLLYPAVDHIRSGYRRSVCGVHSIYYRVEGGTVEIMRILKHQDSARAF